MSLPTSVIIAFTPPALLMLCIVILIVIVTAINKAIIVANIPFSIVLIIIP